MQANFSEDVFKLVLSWLSDSGKGTSKIAMQKLIFFLQEKGENFGYQFEPYTYGPFSKQVMNIATSLSEKGLISVHQRDYVIDQEFKYDIDEKKQERLREYLNSFQSFLKDDFSFDNLELYGTTLYCMKALDEVGESTDEDSVIAEFKAWKGRKYPEEDIKVAREELLPAFFA